MITVNSTFMDQGYWAECSECDWIGTARTTNDEAVADGNMHDCPTELGNVRK